MILIDIIFDKIWGSCCTYWQAVILFVKCKLNDILTFYLVWKRCLIEPYHSHCRNKPPIYMKIGLEMMFKDIRCLRSVSGVVSSTRGRMRSRWPVVWDLCAVLLSGFTSAGRTSWNTCTHTYTFINMGFQALASVKVIYSITSHKLISINTKIHTHTHVHLGCGEARAVTCAGLRQICEEMKQNKECRFTAG